MKKLKKILIAILPFAIGAAVGFFIVPIFTGGGSGEATGYYEGTRSLFETIARAAILIASIFVGYYFHIIVHEAGHLVAGKLSGYMLVSFRVGKLTVVRKGDKLVRKKYDIAGTGGQCLMSPPDVTDEQYKFPISLYNLGGGLANILFAALFSVVALLTTGLISLIFAFIAGVGIFIALLNLIPLKIGGVPNDAMNLLVCRKDSESRRALWIQLKFVALLTQGVRLIDMPHDWVDDIGTPSSALTGFLAALRCNYLLEKGEIEQANDYAKSVIENPGKMFMLHVYELECDVLFIELIGECRAEEIERLYTEDLRKFMKAHATHLSTQRRLYAYELLHKKDEEEANEVLANFEKVCLQTPFEGEIEGERKLVELVKQRSMGQ